jgi:multicomponent Na+:H+ antiporter subunit C
LHYLLYNQTTVEIILSFITGILYASGIYLMLHRNFVKMLMGIVLLGHAANMFIFVVGRITRGTPALIEEGATLPPEPFADPLPQALILTAIVIGFGIQAFAIVLLKRTYNVVKTDDLDDLNETDKIDGIYP